MRVAFRADASRAMGTGHVMRCLTLASALRERGAEASFIMRHHEGHLAMLVAELGFAATVLPLGSVEPGSNGAAHAAWLGGRWEEDADDTLHALALAGDPVDWMIVDHYAIDRLWESRVRTGARRVMVIDDLADREHDCDLLLDQNLVTSLRTRYDGKVGEECALLLGPTYALLRPEYAALHERAVAREGMIRRVLVSFGGSDEHNFTGRALAAMLALGREDIQVDVVVGPANPHAEELRAQATRRPEVSIHHGLTSLAPLLVQADLAIGGAGATSWERLCLGVPSVVVAQADNQRAIAEALHENELAHWLGDAESATTSRFHEVLGDLLRRGLPGNWSRRCLAMVDGRGVARVRATISTAHDITLRPRAACVDDEALLLEWANDPITRRNAFSEKSITPREHHAWLRARLADADGCHLYVVETDDAVPIGQVRFDRLADAWRLSYALAPAFRGRRLGRPLLEAAIADLARREPHATLVAEVKPANSSSQRVLRSLGFTESRVGDVFEYRRSLEST